MTTNLASMSIFVALMLSPVFTQLQALAAASPVPTAILSAKNIFISNGDQTATSFLSLLLAIPTGLARSSTRPSRALARSSSLTTQRTPILYWNCSLRRPMVPRRAASRNGAADPLPMFRLVVYDRKTHYVLWTLTRSVEFAFRQKMHDRNFDDALNLLLDDFLAVAGKQAPQTR